MNAQLQLELTAEEMVLRLKNIKGEVESGLGGEQESGRSKEDQRRKKPQILLILLILIRGQKEVGGQTHLALTSVGSCRKVL